MVRSGIALAKSANSGSWGKYSVFSTQTPTRQHPRAGPKVVAGQLTLKPSVFHLRVGVPTGGMTDPPKPVGTRRLQRIQHRRHALPEVQVGVTDDGCGGRLGPYRPLALAAARP